MARRDLGPGITRFRKGYRVFVRVRLGLKQYRLRTKTFPITATLTEMKAWREAQRVRARLQTGPATKPGTLAEDIEVYLGQVAAMPTLAWRKRDLEAWREAFGDVPRHDLTQGLIRAQLHRWRTEGPVLRFDPRRKTYRALTQPLSASACNHRRTALLHLWTVLDGRDAPNPVRAVPPFREPPAEPRGRSLEFLLAALGRLRNRKQRARARVLLWTGIRGNSELARMSADHVDLDAGLCRVPTGKGGARYRVVPLNADGVEAWREFITLKCWGDYDRNALRKSIALACRREAEARGLPAAHVRAYDLRHSIASAMLGASADLADVQEMLGHTTPRMTRRYAPYDPAKLLRAAKRLGRNVTHPVTYGDDEADEH